MTRTKIEPTPPGVRDNMTTRQAADYLGTSEQYLRELRMNGARKGRMRPPPFVRLSSRKVLYRRCDLDAWLTEHLVQPNTGEGV